MPLRPIPHLQNRDTIGSRSSSMCSTGIAQAMSRSPRYWQVGHQALWSALVLPRLSSSKSADSSNTRYTEMRMSVHCARPTLPSHNHHRRMLPFPNIRLERQPGFRRPQNLRRARPVCRNLVGRHPRQQRQQRRLLLPEREHSVHPLFHPPRSKPYA